MKDFLNIFIIIRKRGFRFFWDYFKESIWFDLRFGTSTFLRVPKIKQKIKIEDNRNDDGLLYVASFTSVIFKTSAESFIKAALVICLYSDLPVDML